MRRTASEVLSDLEIRVARLEREALYPSRQMDVRGPRRQRGPGRLSLREMTKNAKDLLRSAKMLGFKRATLDYDEDNPVIDLGIRQHKIYVDMVGYHLIFPPARTMTIMQYDEVKVLLARQAYELGLRDVPDASPRHEDAGFEEMGMDMEPERTPTFDDIQIMLFDKSDSDDIREGGWLGQHWKRTSDGSFVGGEYSFDVKLTNRGIKFMLVGPFLKRGEAVSTIRGMVNGEGRSEQLHALADRMDLISAGAEKRFEKRFSDRVYVYKLKLNQGR